MFQVQIDVPLKLCKDMNFAPLEFKRCFEKCQKVGNILQPNSFNFSLEDFVCLFLLFEMGESTCKSIYSTSNLYFLVPLYCLIVVVWNKCDSCDLFVKTFAKLCKIPSFEIHLFESLFINFHILYSEQLVNLFTDHQFYLEQFHRVLLS